MAITALTADQQTKIAVLIRGRRVETVPVDPSRATSFLRQAQDRLGQVPLLTSSAVTYSVAYDAAHDVGEALLAAFGWRTVNGPGQHEAVGRFLRSVLDQPPADRAAKAFDRLRRARNQDRYNAQPVGAAAANEAVQVARTLVAAALALGVDP